ncbi:MAG: DUF5360 family protein [Micropepsaceae bacterium]
MPKGLSTALLLTDLGFIAYWSLTALVAAGLFSVPPEYLYSDYHNPLVVAWNWSFMPLDIILSLAGLNAVRLRRAGNPSWRGWTIFSLALTVCAGLMAISFWTIRGDFDVTWWTINLALMLWPWLYLPTLIKS